MNQSVSKMSDTMLEMPDVYGFDLPSATFEDQIVRSMVLSFREILPKIKEVRDIIVVPLSVPKQRRFGWHSYLESWDFDGKDWTPERGLWEHDSVLTLSLETVRKTGIKWQEFSMSVAKRVTAILRAYSGFKILTNEEKEALLHGKFYDSAKPEKGSSDG